MQFLASLHIVLTCSVVFLLAYLLSRIFTFLAHSVIHGRTQGSRTHTRNVSFKPQLQQQGAAYMDAVDADADAAVMAQLQEEDEEDDDDDDDEKDAYHDAEVRTQAPTSKFDMGAHIFDDEYDLKRDDAKCDDNGEGGGTGSADGNATDHERYEPTELEHKDNDGDATDHERYGPTELEHKDNDGNGGMRKSEDAGENLSKEEMAAAGAPDKSVQLEDAQGSSSMQQRLPPTWSDLERMVNMSSKKHSAPPSVSALPE